MDDPPTDISFIQGAESRIHFEPCFGFPSVVKERFQKAYRHPQLDKSLTHSRIINEAKILLRTRKAGIPAPTVYFVDLQQRKLQMEYISGPNLYQFLESEIYNVESAEISNVVQDITSQIGTYLFRMHQSSIIHADITTSNIIINNRNSTFNSSSLHPLLQATTAPSIKNDSSSLLVYFIDFGLSYISSDIEDKAVDLHAFEKVLHSCHPNYPEFFEACFNTYIEQHTNKAQRDNLINRLKQVRLRGRKRIMDS